ncbi:MAG: ribosomal protein L11 methyltransferase [Saprospiraceae bacterium]|jgi:ribosomal protein L11 methyltransferase|tara:strand:- start:204 stop:1019 length:816 start_codon:yes stop_codon:yes gene_type:complete
MKTYKSYTIQSTSEIIIGLLSIYPFESFEEHDTYMIAYIPEDELSTDVAKEVEAVLNRLKTTFTIETIEPQNWNALWESSFEPVVVDDFCVVRADFHDKMENVKHDIIINPKMAFGTGHHETTYMMMSAMRNMIITDKTIFDYGCGTGILAILASKLNSGAIDAIDIEQESYDNTLENAQINSVSNINVDCATLETFDAKVYDVILANINRNVLLNSSKELYSRLASDGVLLLSGILEDDEVLVTDKYTASGFKVKEIYSRGYWKCIQLSK